MINGRNMRIYLTSLQFTKNDRYKNGTAVSDNIDLRGKIKQEIVNVSDKLKRPDILEAEFNSLSNNMFHQFSKEVQEEVGLPTSEMVFPRWQKWLMKEIKGKKF